MAVWLKKCSILSQTAKGYMVELQVMTDEVCQWLDKFEEEAVAYLSSSTTHESKELLPPKTPVRQKRLRKRHFKVQYNEDTDYSSPSCKSTRVDEKDHNPPVNQSKVLTPAKPPRRGKLVFDSNQAVQATPESSKAVEGKSPSLALREISNTPKIQKAKSSPFSLRKATQQSNHDSIVATQLRLKRLSTSQRRSSIARIKARQSIRRSARLSEKIKRQTITIYENYDGIDSCAAAQETSEPTIDVRHTKRTETSFVQCGSTRSTSPGDGDLQNALPNALNSTRTISVEEINDRFSENSMEDTPIHDDIESDVDSVISKTPSPVCPANKVIRPKMTLNPTRKPQTLVPTSAVRCTYKTPLAKKSIASKPKGQTKGPCSKSSIGGFSELKLRKSSLTNNNSYNHNLSRLSPKPMTPQQKQEKCREMLNLREQKSKETLRRRDESLKKTIEERKRKRTEKLLKAKMQKVKIEEARLARIKEEEERMLQRKKMQEEAEKRRIAQEKQAAKELEKQAAKELEKQAAKELEKQAAKELEKQAAKELEQQRLMEQRQKEFEERERIQREAELKTAEETEEKALNVLNTTITIEKTVLNNTIALDNTHNESNNYNMTPQPVYPKPNRHADNYDIDNLNEGDGTDDDEQPRQVVPRWAQGHDFRKAILQQLRANINYETIFPPEELMLLPNLTEIFHVRKKRFDKRTSSAVWSSPVWKDT